MIDKILEWYPHEEILKCEGFDEAIIGVADDSMRLIYSIKKCIEILMVDMNEEEAMEFFNFNIRCAYVGEKTPIWCIDDF
tara:strand:+ start:1177 stop:1416 length:240 start_codon:yes stop_codon:yes gene_type:complete